MTNPRRASLYAVVAVLTLIGMLPMADAAVVPGYRLWATRTTASASLQAVAVSPDGSLVYATGSDYTGFLTIAYDRDTGDEAWSSMLDGPNADGATEIVVAPDGSKVFVSGLSTGTTTDWDFGTVAYDATTGEQLWSRRFDGNGGPDWANAIAVSPDGGTVVVAGSVATAPDPDHSDFDTDAATVAYDATTGAKRWARTYDPANGRGGYAADVVVTASGSAIVTGTTYRDTTGTYVATTAYEVGSGAKVWRSTYGEDAGDVANAMALGPDGATVYLAGYTFSATNAADFATWALDTSTGGQRWLKSKDVSKGGYDEAIDVAVGPDGTVFSTGYTGASLSDALTVAYEPDLGSVKWSARYDGAEHGSDTVFMIAVSGDASKVALTGSTVTPSQPYTQGLTVVYRAETGKLRWFKTFDGKATTVDRTNAVAIAPDSSAVYVAGFQDLDQGVTIAYSS